MTSSLLCSPRMGLPISETLLASASSGVGLPAREHRQEITIQASVVTYSTCMLVTSRLNAQTWSQTYRKKCHTCTLCHILIAVWAAFQDNLASTTWPRRWSFLHTDVTLLKAFVIGGRGGHILGKGTFCGPRKTGHNPKGPRHNRRELVKKKKENFDWKQSLNLNRQYFNSNVCFLVTTSGAMRPWPLPRWWCPPRNFCTLLCFISSLWISDYFSLLISFLLFCCIFSTFQMNNNNMINIVRWFCLALCRSTWAFHPLSLLLFYEKINPRIKTSLQVLHMTLLRWSMVNMLSELQTLFALRWEKLTGWQHYSDYSESRKKQDPRPSLSCKEKLSFIFLFPFISAECKTRHIV